MKMNPKAFLIVMFSAMLIAVGVGNLLTAPAASPCNNGQCNIPQETAAIPPAPAVCDGDCATCPETTCSENPNYTESVGSHESCKRKPLRKAAKAPIKTVGSAGRIATKPFKVFRIFRRR